MFASIVWCVAASLSADEPRDPHAFNQVWLVNTRGAPVPDAQGRVSLEYLRRDGDKWTSASVEEFVDSTGPERPVCVFVHGNRYTSEDARTVGWKLYNSLDQHRPKPFRFVIWSWPADKIDGELRDVREKAMRAEVESYHLAWLMNQLPAERQVSLIGYSYGARLVGGALQVLGGGEVAGRTLPRREPHDRPVFRGALLAGAFDNHWLAPDGYYGRAVSQVDKLLLVINPSDRVLKWYPWLWGTRKGADAIGFTGARGLAPDQAARVATINASRYLGDCHDCEPYADKPEVLSRLANVALFGDAAAKPMATSGKTHTAGR